MPKPQHQIRPFRAGQQTLSASALDAIRLAVRSMFANLTVSAPLSKQQGGEGIHLRIDIDERHLLPPLPDYDAVLAYDNDTHEVYWLATTEDCPLPPTTTTS